MQVQIPFSKPKDPQKKFPMKEKERTNQYPLNPTKHHHNNTHCYLLVVEIGKTKGDLKTTHK